MKRKLLKAVGIYNACHRHNRRIVNHRYGIQWKSLYMDNIGDMLLWHRLNIIISFKRDEKCRI